eukprot:m.38125 g.38125  ORF g.38125 m.38125 type:complete len:74 (-) comp10158_c1_seq1:2453-2674(-)
MMGPRAVLSMISFAAVMTIGVTLMKFTIPTTEEYLKEVPEHRQQATREAMEKQRERNERLMAHLKDIVDSNKK